MRLCDVASEADGRTYGRQRHLCRVLISHVGGSRVKGNSNDKRSKATMIEATSHTSQKGIKYVAATMTNTGITTVVPHCTTLCHDEEGQKRQYDKMEGSHMPDSHVSRVFTNDETRLIRQNGRRGNQQNWTTLHTPPSFTTPSVQLVWKRGRNRKYLNFVSSR